MAYLNNNIVSLDAILTKKGRELIARGDGSFRITQFGLSDDEVDYTMYNPNHPSGSAFAGEAIERMPILEAFADETQIMKSKLVTLPRGTAKMPILDIGYQAINLRQGASIAITPQTLNYLGTNKTFESSGYKVTISDVRLANSFTGVGITSEQAENLNQTQTIGTNISKTVIGTTINITATTVNTLFGSNQALTGTLIVEGRDSGARLSIPITITKTS